MGPVSRRARQAKRPPWEGKPVVSQDRRILLSGRETLEAKKGSCVMDVEAESGSRDPPEAFSVMQAGVAWPRAVALEVEKCLGSAFVVNKESVGFE